MKLILKLNYNDGTHEEVTALPVDFIKLKRELGKDIPQLQAEGFGMEDIGFLAWSAAVRKSGERIDFIKWAERLEELEVLETPDPKATKPEA